MKTLIKGISVDGEIIHKNLKKTFYHVGEKTKNAPLECCWSIAQSKGHASVSKGSEQAGEHGLFLIFYSNRDLIVSRVPI